MKNNIVEEQKANELIRDIVNKEDVYGNTPLALALIQNIQAKKNDKFECAYMLLKMGADPNIKNKRTGFTPMHWAAKHGDLNLVKLLLTNGYSKQFDILPYKIKEKIK